MLSPKKNVWKKLKASGRARVCLTNPLLILLLFVFLADIAMRRFAYVPPMPHWTKPAKKAIMTKRKNSRRRAAGAGSRKTKGKDKESKTGGNGFPGTRYFCAVKEKRKKRNHSV